MGNKEVGKQTQLFLRAISVLLKLLVVIPFVFVVLQREYFSPVTINGDSPLRPVERIQYFQI